MNIMSVSADRLRQAFLDHGVDVNRFDFDNMVRDIKMGAMLTILTKLCLYTTL